MYPPARATNLAAAATYDAGEGPVPARRRSSLAAAVAFAIAAHAHPGGAPAADRPPAETLARLAAAGTLLDSWQGTFVLTTRAVVSKTDGADREESVTVMRMGPGADGPEVREIVSATRAGKDVTAEARAELEKERRKAGSAAREEKSGEEGGDDGLEMTLPGGERTGMFAFTALPLGGGECGAAFAPRPEHAADGGLTTGELRWDCASLDPLRVDARPAKNPKGVKEMSLRMEIARAGDTLYVARTVTDGVGGVLFIKRRFHVETEVGELQGAAAAPEAR